jgi:cyanophycin synthetase
MSEPTSPERSGEVEPVAVREVRILEGPNLYFPRPAVKVSLALPGYQAAGQARMRAVADQVGLRRAAPGAAHTEQRHRFLVRLSSAVLRRIATRVGSRLAVRGRTVADPDDVVVAFP